jgi:FKBP-type peptidyl-prolyl cis-trans isomerase FklB
MRKFSMLLMVGLLVANLSYAQDALTTQQEKLGYAIGMNIGQSMKKQDLEADADQIAAGLLASFKGDKTLLTVEEMAEILTAYQQEMQMKMVAEASAAAAENTKKAEEYLKANGAKDDVKTLPSGLQYKVITAGTGASPTAESTVEVHYKGTLVDGTEFDSSYKRGEPASFPVGGVIPGWTEALQLMKEGDKWELAIPPTLAYGERGAPPVIPPNSALVFEVELLKIVQ